MQERYAAGFRKVTNFGDVQRKAFGVAENRSTFRNERPHPKGSSRAACDQKKNAVGDVLDQPQDRLDALRIGYVCAIYPDLQGCARRKRPCETSVAHVRELEMQSASDVATDRIRVRFRRKRAVNSILCSVAKIAQHRRRFPKARRCD
jgi:hypothetical protein